MLLFFLNERESSSLASHFLAIIPAQEGISSHAKERRHPLSFLCYTKAAGPAKTIKVDQCLATQPQNIARHLSHVPCKLHLGDR
jgi:hypothetical protein